MPLAATCVMRFAHRFILALLLLALAAGSTLAHDPSSYGGVFRSRNLGGTWLRADVGLFLNAPLIVAVDPRNPSHLLAGTDLGLIASHNGGLTWAPEARAGADDATASSTRWPDRHFEPGCSPSL